MAGVKPRNSWISLLKTLEILDIPCEYIFPLMCFTVNNQENFQTNSTIHNVNTRNFTDQLSTFHVFRRVNIILARLEIYLLISQRKDSSVHV